MAKSYRNEPTRGSQRILIIALVALLLIFLFTRFIYPG